MTTTSRNVLILTDHAGHTNENSLYALAVGMYRHQSVLRVDVASRAIAGNADFFAAKQGAPLHATTIDDAFGFREGNDHPLDHDHRIVSVDDYALVWLRLPPPLERPLIDHLVATFSKQCVINDPAGIFESGSKEFLLHFPELCLPMQICRSIADIEHMRKQFPIVLKPLKAYGGKGLVLVDGDTVKKGNEQMPYSRYVQEIEDSNIDFLAVKFTENVGQGDKRIIVVCGEVLGATLRMPPKDSWICNVSLGGTSRVAEVAPEEYQIVDTINPILAKLGIVMYGVDTLVGDEGKRVLSELNTTSIGGLPQIAKFKGEPLVEKAIDLMIRYCETYERKHHVHE